jgi:hypothetical protein
MLGSLAALALALVVGIGAGLGAFALRPAPPPAPVSAATALVYFGDTPSPTGEVDPGEKLEPGLRQFLPDEAAGRVLVHVQGNDALSQLEGAGFRVGTHHPLVGVVEMHVREAELPALADLPCVRRVAAPLDGAGPGVGYSSLPN